ncbi:hypothetical protein D3C75_1316210 [compost metagenome]
MHRSDAQFLDDGVIDFFKARFSFDHIKAVRLFDLRFGCTRLPEPILQVGKPAGQIAVGPVF